MYALMKSTRLEIIILKRLGQYQIFGSVQNLPRDRSNI